MKDDEAFARDREEFEKLLEEEPQPARRRIVMAAIVAGVGVIAAVGVALAVGMGGLGVSAAPGASASPSPTLPGSSPSPVESAATPAPSDSPAPEPEETEGAVPEARETLPPADLDAAVALPSGPSVSVTAIDSVEGEAVLPGEVSGPAVRLTIQVRNDSDETIDLTTAVVTVYGGESGLQASPVSKPAGKAFPSDVAPGKAAEGAFVFELPDAQRSDVRVEVDLSVSDPLIAFEGDIE